MEVALGVAGMTSRSSSAAAKRITGSSTTPTS